MEERCLSDKKNIQHIISDVKFLAEPDPCDKKRRKNHGKPENGKNFEIL